jgi:tRNA(Arg) A34 adenosine deaminase TadA
VTGRRLSLSTEFVLPDWFAELDVPDSSDGDEARMAFVVDLARRNVEHGTGGPFSAAVFSLEEGALISVGVNLVEPSLAAIAHAEIVAIALAGRALGSFDCGVGGPTELVASTEPCAMCLGAVPWSGVTRLVCGASDADARAVGFDEGHKPAGWESLLEEQGIEVVTGVLRELSVSVLTDYAAGGGTIYNTGAAEGVSGA